MPQQGQIVPSWKHPHEMVVINNNTWFLDVTAEREYYSVRSVHVFMSPKGEDRKAIQLTHPNNFKEEFGIGDFNLHGQPYLSAYSFLERNDSVLGYFIRITAPDAQYSHMVVLAKVKPVAASGGDKGSLEIYYETVQLPEFKELDVAKSLIDGMKEDTPDSEGFYTYPVMLIYAKGRGVYGDQLRVRLTKETTLDRENNFLNYRLDVYEMEEYLRLKNTIKGSLNFDAVNQSTSVFMEDLNKSIKIGGKVNFEIFHENLEEIYELYLDTVDPDIIVPFEQFDFFYGKTKIELKDIQGFKILDETTQPNAVAFDTATGVALAGGSDGLFARAKTPAEKIVREAAIEDEYIKVFEGKYDKIILSKRRTPQELFFDANYPEAVKYQIISWLKSRGDGYGHIDAGHLGTVTDAIAWGEQFYNIGDRLYSKHFQTYEVRDPFTQKHVRVTFPYFLATNLPTHFENAGKHIPFAADRTYLTGHVENSVVPDIDADDEVSKELLYELRINYLETLSENVYFRGTQSTSDIGETRDHWSDLNEENNMYILLEYKRRIEDYCFTLRYNFAEPENREIFTKRARAMFENDIGVRVRDVNVYFEMSPWEEERSILHCYLAVTFKSLVKRTVIEIDVNSRVSAAA